MRLFRSDWFSALLVAVGVSIAGGVAMRDYGLTTDEPAYVMNTDAAMNWLRNLPENGADSFSEEGLKDGWRYAHAHSKNLPLVTIVSLAGYYAIGQWDSFPAAYRWGNVLLFALTSAIVFHWANRRYGRQGAFVAIIALLGTPRLFGHAMLLANDTLIACFWVLASWALVNSRGNWRWAIAFAVLAGVGSTSKLTFWFAFPVWGIWGLFNRPRELWRSAVCFFLLAPLTAYLFLPMWWGDPIGGFADYLELLRNDPSGWKIGTYYLGEIYQTSQDSPVPWHAVIVMTAVTTPVWILALGTVGGYQAVKRFRSPDSDAGLWLLSALALPVLCMLPMTPCHDGLRLYRTAFFFLPLLAACGWDRLVHWKRADKTGESSKWEGMQWGVIGVLAVFSAWQVWRIHLGELSYYNLLVGGLNGAATPVESPSTLPETNRPRFEITYWWEAMNREALAEMQTHLPESARLWVFPQHYGLDLLKERGQLREDLQIVYPGQDPQFVLLYGRLASLADRNAAPLATMFLHQKPIWERTINGVRVAALFKWQASPGGTAGGQSQTRQ